MLCSVLRRLYQQGTLLVASSLLVSFLPARLPAQSYERELSLGGKSFLTIRNRSGRVSVIASNNKSTLQATSPGAPVEPGDVSVSGGEINVRERRTQDRIDL